MLRFPLFRLALAATITTVAVGNLGCRKIRERMEEKALEKASGGKLDIDNNGQTVTVKGDKPGDQLVVGNEAKLPDDFPKSVPIYPGAKVTASFSASGSGGGDKGYSVTFETADEPDKVVAFYKSKMPGGKAAQQAEMDTPTGHLLSYKDGDDSVSVVAAKGSPGKNTITLTVSAKKS